MVCLKIMCNLSMHQCVHTGIPEAPQNVSAVSVTAVSVTLSWIPGVSGGVLQTFTVYYRKDGDNKIDFVSDIADPGSGNKVIKTVRNLQPVTLYHISVRGINHYGRSFEDNEFQVTTLGKAHNSFNLLDPLSWLCFWVCSCVCLSVCIYDYSKINEYIFVLFFAGV